LQNAVSAGLFRKLDIASVRLLCDGTSLLCHTVNLQRLNVNSQHCDVNLQFDDVSPQYRDVNLQYNDASVQGSNVNRKHRNNHAHQTLGFHPARLSKMFRFGTLARF